MSDRKHIYSKADRRWKPSKIPEGEADEAFACDHTRACEVCGEKPVVNATGLCGPCTDREGIGAALCLVMLVASLIFLGGMLP